MCLEEVGSCALYFWSGLTTLLVSFNAQDPAEEETGRLCHGLQGEQIDNLRTKRTRNFRGHFGKDDKDVMQQKMLEKIFSM